MNFIIYICIAVVIFKNIVFVKGLKSSIDFMAELKNKTDILLPPTSHTHRPTEVRAGIYINTLHIEEGSKMHMTASMYFRRGWNDPRLAFNLDEYDSYVLLLPDKSRDKIWIPDIFFRDEMDKKSIAHGREAELVKVNSTGYVTYASRIITTVFCHMKLEKYPFDTQSCSIRFESFRHLINVMNLKWMTSDTAEINSEIELHTFTIQDNHTSDCSENYTSGMFPCLEFRISLKRRSSQFYVQTLFPSIITVVMSWFSFWMGVDRYIERVMVLFILVLTLIVQFSFTSNAMLQIGYITAVDVWMVICLIFLFLALVEATLVKVIGVRASYNNNQYSESVGGFYFPKVARLFDVASRAVVPFLFVLAMIIYFGVYSN